MTSPVTSSSSSSAADNHYKLPPPANQPTRSFANMKRGVAVEKPLAAVIREPLALILVLNPKNDHRVGCETNTLS